MAPEPMQVPHQVSRFYGNTEFATDVIANRQITFVHASLLNDPFDPYSFFETDFGDNYPNLLKYVRDNHKDDLPWFRAHVTAQSWGRTVIELKAYLQRLRDTTFVLSTCAEYPGVPPEHNLYMWGHYAHGHRGMAIEFNTQALANAVLTHHTTVTGRPLGETKVWAKMEYAKTFAPITAEDVFQFMKQEMDVSTRKRSERVPTQLDTYYNRMSTIKSDVWQSESEWRLMWRNDESNKTIYRCPIGEDAIAKIFLGMILPPEIRDKIVAAAKANFPSVPIFQAKKRPGDLSLKFDRVKP